MAEKMIPKDEYTTILETKGVSHAMTPGCHWSGEQMLRQWSKMMKEVPKGPKIDKDSIVFAGLDLFALEGAAIAKLEELIDVEIGWCEYAEDGKIGILNPSDFKIDLSFKPLVKPEEPPYYCNVPTNILPMKLQNERKERRKELMKNYSMWQYTPIMYPISPIIIDGV